MRGVEGSAVSSDPESGLPPNAGGDAGGAGLGTRWGISILSGDLLARERWWGGLARGNRGNVDMVGCEGE